MIDTAKLKDIASKATPGPWEIAEPLRADAHPHGIIVVRDGRFFKVANAEVNDAWHIKSFDPPTVLALIAELEKARRDNAEAYGYAVGFLQSYVGRHFEHSVTPLEDVTGVLTQIDNASTITRDFKAQRDSARAQVAALREALTTIADGREVHRGGHTEMEDISDPSGVARAALEMSGGVKASID